MWPDWTSVPECISVMLTCKYTGLKEIDRRTVIDRTCAGLNFYVEAHHVKRLNLYDAHRVMFMFLSLFSSLTLSLSQHGGRGNRFILHIQKNIQCPCNQLHCSNPRTHKEHASVFQKCNFSLSISWVCYIMILSWISLWKRFSDNLKKD